MVSYNKMAQVPLYIVVIAILFVVIICVLYQQQSNHQQQLDKIHALEDKYVQKERELNRLRNMSSECPIPGLGDPRSCYYGSNYTCSWNDLVGRCDLIQ